MRFRKIPLATCGREWRGGRETGRRLWTESGEDDGGQTRALQQQWGDLELESLRPGCLSGEGRGRKNPTLPSSGLGPQLDSAALDQNTTTLWEDGRSVGLLPYNQTQTSTRGTPAGTSPRVPFLENSPPTPSPQQARKHSPPLARGWLLGACRFG